MTPTIEERRIALATGKSLLHDLMQEKIESGKVLWYAIVPILDDDKIELKQVRIANDRPVSLFSEVRINAKRAC